MITGAVLMDLSAAYDTVNHLFVSKVLEITGNVHLTDLIRTKLESRRFFMVLNGKKIRWRRQRNGLPCVLAPMLFNIYTNNQPIHPDTRSIIYTDELCIASQENDVNNTEASLTSAVSTMTTYYDTNQLHATKKTPHRVRSRWHWRPWQWETVLKRSFQCDCGHRAIKRTLRRQR